MLTGRLQGFRRQKFDNPQNNKEKKWKRDKREKPTQVRSRKSTDCPIISRFLPVPAKVLRTTAMAKVSLKVNKDGINQLSNLKL